MSNALIKTLFAGLTVAAIGAAGVAPAFAGETIRNTIVRTDGLGDKFVKQRFVKTDRFGDRLSGVRIAKTDAEGDRFVVSRVVRTDAFGDKTIKSSRVVVRAPH